MVPPGQLSQSLQSDEDVAGVEQCMTHFWKTSAQPRGDAGAGECIERMLALHACGGRLLPEGRSQVPDQQQLPVASVRAGEQPALQVGG